MPAVIYACTSNSRYGFEIPFVFASCLPQLLDLLDSVKETGRMDFTLTPAQRLAITRLKGVGEVMEASLSQIDEQIALFNDY